MTDGRKKRVTKWSVVEVLLLREIRRSILVHTLVAVQAESCFVSQLFRSVVSTDPNLRVYSGIVFGLHVSDLFPIAECQ
jgi:hypothetical protein